jgi:exopolysaccharide production protein ExoQ
MQTDHRSWWGLVPAAIFIVAAGLGGLLGGDGALSGTAAGTGYGFTEDPRRLIVYGLAYFWALMWLLPRAGEALQLARRTWPLWLLVAYACSSMLWSRIPFKVFINCGHYAGETLVALAAVCAVRHDLRRLSLLLVATLGAVAVLSLLAVRLGWPNAIDIETGRWGGAAGNANTLGLISATLIGAAANLFLARSSWLVRLGSVVFAIAGVITLHGSGSATSLVFALVLTAGTVWLQLGRKDAATGLSARVLSGVFILCLAGALAVGFLPETFQAQTWLAALGKSQTLTGRTEVWNFAWRLYLLNPFLGYGFDSLASVLYGFYRGVGHMHNGYLDLLVRGGSVGLILFLVVLVRAIYRLLQLAARTPEAAFWLMFVIADLVYELAEASIMRPVHVLWLVFVIAATVAEQDRVCQQAAESSPASRDRHRHDTPAGSVAIPNLLR